MVFSNDFAAEDDPQSSSRDSDAKIVRWSEDPEGLSPEECARRGIEALAGLVISGDIFGTNRHPDAHFCTCAEIHHAVAGTSDNFDDHIVVTFRVVDIKDGIYPLVGQESVRMVMQPMSDSNVSARWNAIDRSPFGQQPEGVGSAVEELDMLSGVSRPLTLGPIGEQEAANDGPVSFLMLKDPGAGWQIWRRFQYEAGGAEGRPFREESYSMIYPVLSPEMNWRFRIYDIPGGGIRWEVNSDNRG